MKQGNILFLTLLIPALISCSTTKSTPTKPLRPEQHINPVTANAVTLVSPVTTTATAPALAPTPAPQINIYSPYSSEGLQALNEFRSNSSTLNDFLVRNRKPDYFFSGINTDFSYQKIYLVYLESENLYLFDAKLQEPYKKFHPLPESVRSNFKGLLPDKPTVQNSTLSSQASTQQPITQQPFSQNNATEMALPSTIEKTLAVKKPEPYLSTSLLYQIPHEGLDNNSGSNPLYPDLYFLDMPLDDLLENQYSAKYDSKKHILKLIFPKSYEAGMLYKKPDTETRKIFVENNAGSGKELSVIVPDFLPGSAFYRTTHGNIAKAFSSLYQINVPQNFIDSSQLHMRYSIKLCQNDKLDYCAIKKNNATYVRAIVIEATLYDSATRLPIETFVLK